MGLRPSIRDARCVFSCYQSHERLRLRRRPSAAVVVVVPVHLRVDPAEAHRDFEGLRETDRRDLAPLLGELDPQSGLARIMDVEPRLERLLVSNGRAVHPVDGGCSISSVGMSGVWHDEIDLLSTSDPWVSYILG